MNRKDQIEDLIELLKLEKKAQSEKWTLSENTTLKQLKAQGLVIHPIKIIRKTFGYADYPTLEFSIPFDGDYSNFKSGCSVELIGSNDKTCAAFLNYVQGKKGEIRLFAPDFPEWTEDKGLGIKLVPDDRSFNEMEKALKNLKQDERSVSSKLFNVIHGFSTQIVTNPNNYQNKELNLSQNVAIQKMISNQDVCILHGPPGTGKTTTLIEGIKQLTQKGEKVLVAAPSNTAVNHIALGLIKENIPVLRLGNTSKVDEKLLPFTPEGILSNSEDTKRIKKLKIQANEFRKLANQYKRSFGKAEREQRKLLVKEVKAIRSEIKNIEQAGIESAFNSAKVICGTPVGLMHELLEDKAFDCVIIDEAGQCLEPMAWVVLQKGNRLVLAGDPLQLPPTVISEEAAKKGLTISILERCFKTGLTSNLLNTQYRMKSDIAGFSSTFFYENKLQTADHLISDEKNICFIDTAGSDAEEKKGQDGYSLNNPKELEVIEQLINSELIDSSKTAFISPYAGQVSLLKSSFRNLRAFTIDSFQGQEANTVVISLVRSNNEGNIGFLKDYRRMNVALTRAKEKLFVIGDSSTLGTDKFYGSFLDYVEENGSYKSVFELVY
ncbi:MAG: AAA domain-containing protein [Lishizhenia sp.]